MTYIATVYDAESDWGTEHEFSSFAEAHTALLAEGFEQIDAEFGHDRFIASYARDQLGWEAHGATAEIAF